MGILSIDVTTKVSDTLRFNVDYIITIRDIIDMVLLLLTAWSTEDSPVLFSHTAC